MEHLYLRQEISPIHSVQEEGEEEGNNTSGDDLQVAWVHVCRVSLLSLILFRDKSCDSYA